MDFIKKIFELFTTEKYMDIIFKGLGTTVSISVVAAILGLILGVVVAFVSIAPKTRITSIFKAICKVYVTIVRGTPMALQLFIMAYVVFAIRGFPKFLTASIAFGINSGAYVAENIRAGILSVDIGQTEAGLALGLPYRTTMLKIVIPQAMKNVIPAIGNELIALIKSNIPIMLTIDVSLIRAMNSLPRVGIIFFIAWGITIFIIVAVKLRPIARPPSI